MRGGFSSQPAPAVGHGALESAGLPPRSPYGAHASDATMNLDL